MLLALPRFLRILSVTVVQCVPSHNAYIMCTGRVFLLVLSETFFTSQSYRSDALKIKALIDGSMKRSAAERTLSVFDVTADMKRL